MKYSRNPHIRNMEEILHLFTLAEGQPTEIIYGRKVP
jgi:hypothetical protein